MAAMSAVVADGRSGGRTAVRALLLLLLLTALLCTAAEPFGGGGSGGGGVGIHIGGGVNLGLGELQRCPKACTCTGPTVDCANRGLAQVPRRIPVDTERL